MKTLRRRRSIFEILRTEKRLEGKEERNDLGILTFVMKNNESLIDNSPFIITQGANCIYTSSPKISVEV